MVLSRSQVRALEETRPWLRRRDSAFYGRRLEDVVRESDEMEFLADAIQARHLPDIDGVSMALETYTAFVLAEARADAVTKPHLAQVWLDETAEEYRRLSARLLQDAARLHALASGDVAASGDVTPTAEAG